MVDLVSTLTKMQGYMGLSNQSSPRASAEKVNPRDNDAFSNLFNKAITKSFSKKTEISATKSTDKALEEKLPEEELEVDDDTDTKTVAVSDELAALASLTIQNPQAEIEQPEPEVKAETKAVVSILEGNMDIEAQAPEAELPLQDTKAAPTVTAPPEAPVDTEATEVPAAPVKDAPTQEAVIPPEQDEAEELTARMPQETGIAPKNAETEKKPDLSAKMNTEAPPAEEEGPCPLENKNDSVKKDSAFDSQPEKNTKDETKTDYSQVPQQKIDITPERLSGTERMNAQAENQPATATTETLFDAMVQKIEMANVSETTLMDIQLKPEYLGKVTIQLALGDSGLEIKIKAEDAGVKGLLAEQITQLRDSLLDKGIKVTDVEVVQTNVADHAFGDSDFRDESQAFGETQIYRPRAREGDFGLPLQPDEMTAVGATMMDAGISSVEYRA